MPEKKDKKLSGPQKAAILMLALGEQVAAELLKYLKPEEIKKLGIEMGNLRGVDPKTTADVLAEFNDQFQDTDSIRVLGEEYFKNLLPNALDPEKAQEVIRAIEKEKERIPFKNIRELDARVLANFLRAEHPQTIALVMAHLGEEKAAQVISHLPQGLQFEVINRIVNLETVPSDIVREVDEALEQELLSLGGEMQQILGGVQKVAEILNRCDR
jgi:flagellar motor switch protein FliG